MYSRFVASSCIFLEYNAGVRCIDKFNYIIFPFLFNLLPWRSSFYPCSYRLLLVNKLALFDNEVDPNLLFLGVAGLETVTLDAAVEILNFFYELLGVLVS